MKPVIIIAMAFVLLIPLPVGSSNLIQQSYPMLHLWRLGLLYAQYSIVSNVLKGINRMSKVEAFGN